MDLENAKIRQPKWDEKECPILKELAKVVDKNKVFWWCFQPKTGFGDDHWECNLDIDGKQFGSEKHTTKYNALANAVDKGLKGLDS